MSSLVLALLTAAPVTEHAALLTRAHAELQTAGGPSAATMQELAEAVDEEPKNLDLLTAYGYVLRRSGQPEAALVPLQKALKRGQTRAEGQPVALHEVVVATLIELEQFPEAAEVYRTYGYPLLPRTHQILALRLAQTAANDETAAAARVHADKAVELAPDEPTSSLCLGLALLLKSGTGDTPIEEAISTLGRAFELREQGKSDGLFADGWPAALEAHGRHSLGRLMAQNPPSPTENTRLELARQQFAKASALVPGHKPYSTSLTEIYSAMVQRQQALGTSDTAMKAEVDAALARDASARAQLGSVPIIDLNKPEL